MTPRRLPLLSLAAVTLVGCYDSPTETPNDVKPAAAKIGVEAFEGTAFADAGEAFVLLATTNSGKLLEIDVDAGAVRQIGQSQTFAGFKPGWTGITKDAAGVVYTTSRTKDDPRADGTHLYKIDAATGLVTSDLGTTGYWNVSDIDVGTVAGGAGPVMWASGYDGGTDTGRLLTVNPVSGVATPIGHFSDASTVGLDGGYSLINGGLSVDPTTGLLWGIENKYHYIAVGPRLFTIDPVTGHVNSTPKLVTIAGAPGVIPTHGFDALEIMPDGRFFATRSRDRDAGAAAPVPFEIYSINPADAVATLVSLTLPPLFQGVANGLETTTAPRSLTLDVTSAQMTLEPTGVPGGDDFTLDADFTLGAGNNGLDLTNEAFVIAFGDLSFAIPAGQFSAVGGGFEYTSGGPGLTLVLVDEVGGMIHLGGSGLTLSSLTLGPVPVNLQMGDDVGTTTATFTAPSGIPAQPGAEFYAVTNEGELVVIDLGAGTATLIGPAAGGGGGGGGGSGGGGGGGGGGAVAANPGWTGLAFSSDGRLFTSSRWRDGDPADGCDGGAFPTGGRCAHIYQIDPGTGAVITEVGNAGIQYLSDLQFGADGILFGSEFINGRPLRDGGLVKIDLASGATVQKFTYGTFNSLIVGNGGLALDPNTGELWGVEANDLFPRLFKIDGVTGKAYDPVRLLLNGQFVDFGFDGLEILADGRFYATRGRGYQEVYRINPTSGEIRVQALTIPASITGGLNGLDVFVEPSGAPPPPVNIGVRDTFLRKDKSGKSDKSAKSAKSSKGGKSAKSGSKKSKKSNKSVKAPDNRHFNEGGNPRLELQKDQDVLLAFEVDDLDFSTVTSARVVLTIDPAQGSTGWKTKGVNADIHHLKTDFVEGNGINTGPEVDQFPGTGVGATWECAADQDVSNLEGDCAKADKWQGAKKRGKKTDRVRLLNDITGTVSFDVTADLQKGRTMWVVEVDGQDGGSIVFFSKEGSVVLGDFTLAPRLVIQTGS